MAQKNAASVFPEPVGAKRSVDSPLAMAGQASSWARVGASKQPENHRWEAGAKGLSGVGRVIGGRLGDLISMTQTHRRLEGQSQ